MITWEQYCNIVTNLARDVQLMRSDLSYALQAIRRIENYLQWDGFKNAKPEIVSDLVEISKTLSGIHLEGVPLIEDTLPIFNSLSKPEVAENTPEVETVVEQTPVVEEVEDSIPSLRKRIAKFKSDNKFTQTELSQFLGVSIPTIKRIYDGYDVKNHIKEKILKVLDNYS